MILKTARRLRDFLRKHNIKATVPLGFTGDDYYVKAEIGRETMMFKTVTEYKSHAKWQYANYVRFCKKNGIRQYAKPPIMQMIDEACGREG